MRYVLCSLAAGFAMLTATAVGLAATGPRTPAPTPDSVYRPVTSDLMNSVIQPRHIKLWLAGQARNWVFADYERHNIGGALARMAEAIPVYKGRRMPI
jgi:hypothetical protein